MGDSKTTKFMNVFSLISFALYGISPYCKDGLRCKACVGYMIYRALVFFFLQSSTSKHRVGRVH